MKISVIMLTFNRAKYVADAINSILNQTFNDFEFIIVNNGSVDGSGEIAKDLTKNDPRVQIFNIPINIGIGAARNKGLDLSKGEFITYIDDDDFVEPDMLEFLFDLIVRFDADISICGSTKETNGIRSPNYVFDELLVLNAQEAVVEMLKRKKYNVAMPTKLLSRNLFHNNRFLEHGNYDDITVGYKFLANSNKVVAQGFPKYCFRRHENNNSAFTTNDLLITPNQLDEYLKAFRERTVYISELMPEISNFVRYSEWSYMISMYNKIISSNLTNCQVQLELIRRDLTNNCNEFYYGKFIQQFEKEYMEKYIFLKQRNNYFRKVEYK